MLAVSRYSLLLHFVQSLLSYFASLITSLIFVPPFGRHSVYCSLLYLFIPYKLRFDWYNNSLSFGLKSSLTFLPSVGFSRIFDTPSGSFVRKPYSLLKLTIIILVYLVVKERSDWTTLVTERSEGTVVSELWPKGITNESERSERYTEWVSWETNEDKRS